MGGGWRLTLCKYANIRRMKIIKFTPDAVDFVRDHTQYRPAWPDAIGLGLYSEGKLVAGAVYEDFTRNNVNVHIAFAHPHALTPAFIVAGFKLPFIDMKLPRITGLVPAKNERALRFDLKLGWQVEGLIRRGLPDDDIILLGMLKDECRFIRGL